MTKEELKNTAIQAAINIKEEEFEETYQKISSVIDYLSILDDYEMRPIEVSEYMIEDVNRWREDIPVSSISLQEALSNATRKNENFFNLQTFLEYNQKHNAFLIYI